MISFKQFLDESYETYKYNDMTQHLHDLGTHHLHVIFREKPDKSADVDFMLQRKDKLEGTYNRGSTGSNLSGKQKVSAISKVKQSIHDYIKKNRPRQFSMGGNTEKKKKMYAKFGNTLARKYHGKRVLGNPSGTVHLKFPRHAKPKVDHLSTLVGINDHL